MKYNLKPSEVLQELLYLDDNELQFLLYCVERGFQNQWDCDLEYARKNFSSGEWKLAIKTAKNIAKTIENNNSGN
jgi:hypothetical protein